jgi:hypothetical protein
MVYLKAVDQPKRNRLAGKSGGRAEPNCRRQARLAINLAGSNIGGGDGKLRGMIRRDKLDLADMTVIGQVAQQDNRTNKEDQAPHGDTLVSQIPNLICIIKLAGLLASG